MTSASLLAALDRIPRTHVATQWRPVPAFRTCGVTGFYLAVLSMIAGTLVTGRSLVVSLTLCVVCGLSFFVYTYVRMWITGAEALVLLEHVWFAELCVAAALRLIGEPLLPYLDLVAVSLCWFLAAGRVGCTLAGCCHGYPSSFGIVYRADPASDGLARHLVGVRVFPVAAIEAIGLVAIGAAGFIALPSAPNGSVVVWFLLAYGVMRFALEGLRGDRRPHFLGLSQARWMSLVEVAVGIWVMEERAGTTTVARFAGAAAGVVVVAISGAHYARSFRRRALRGAHVAEVRATGHLVPNDPKLHDEAKESLRAAQTSIGVTVATSRAAGADGAARVSLSLPPGERDLPTLCTLAARAFPTLQLDDARVSDRGVLHVSVPAGGGNGIAPAIVDTIGDRLYGHIARQQQRESDAGAAVASVAPAITRTEYFARRSGNGRHIGT